MSRRAWWNCRSRWSRAGRPSSRHGTEPPGWGSADEHAGDDRGEHGHADHDAREEPDLGTGNPHVPRSGKVVLPLRERLELRGIRAQVIINIGHGATLACYACSEGANESARSISLDSTMTLLVRTTNGSAPIRSITCSKCLTSAALMCTSASASPVTVQASATSG